MYLRGASSLEARYLRDGPHRWKHDTCETALIAGSTIPAGGLIAGSTMPAGRASSLEELYGPDGVRERPFRRNLIAKPPDKLVITVVIASFGDRPFAGSRGARPRVAGSLENLAGRPGRGRRPRGSGGQCQAALVIAGRRRLFDQRLGKVALAGLPI